MANGNGMDKFLIEGGNHLTGEVTPSGNKNSVLPIMCAAILASEPVTLTNVPNILDVEVTAEIFKSLGGKVDWNCKKQVMTLDPTKIDKHEVSAEQTQKLRASNLFMGPLWARFGEAISHTPGGDKIGPREMTAHYVAFRGLGGKVTTEQNTITIKGKPKGNRIFLYDPSVTATENAISAAVLAKGTTVLENAACEPHVQELCHFLNSMGAKIEGIGNNNLTIHGVERLGGTTHEIWPDFMDVGTTIVLAGITRGRIRIKNVRHEDLVSMLYFFESFNLKTEKDGNDLLVPGNQELYTVDQEWSRIKGVYCQPWPGFPTDVLSVVVVLATQTQGTTLIFEKMYPGRLYFASFLAGMGANVILCDPHRIVVTGKTRLKATRLVAPDIRAGMAYVAAALVAKGTSIVESVLHIDRGYPNIEKRLQKLGAKISRVNEEGKCHPKK